MSERRVSLIVGAEGMIGGALANRLACAGETVLETTILPETVSKRRMLLDLSNDVSGWRPPCLVSSAYLCAAVTSIECCRKKPEETARVNVHNTMALAKTLVAGGAFVVFPSTNQVFDGSVAFRKAEDAVCPATEYGRQKAEVERQLLALGAPAAVVRFTKVLGPGTPLLKGWMQALKNNQEIRPFSDMVIAPVPLAFAVEVLLHVAEERAQGIVQVSSEQEITYERVARHIAKRTDASQDLIRPVRSTEAGLHPETAPLHTTLDTTRLREEFGMEPPDVWTTIDSVMER